MLIFCCHDRYCYDHIQRSGLLRLQSNYKWNAEELDKQKEEIARQMSDLVKRQWSGNNNQSDEEIEQKKSDDINNTVCPL